MKDCDHDQTMWPNPIVNGIGESKDRCLADISMYNRITVRLIRNFVKGLFDFADKFMP